MDIEEKLEKEYPTIIKTIANVEAEIDCAVRQKQLHTVNLSELIKAQKKLTEAQRLIEHLLKEINKYHILEDEIKKQIEIENQKMYQKKQHELDKKYAR